MNVLVIDDHPLILAALKSVVTGLAEGVTVTGVTTAQAALESMATCGTFDLVLLDLHLGQDDGFALLSELRTTYPAVSIVVVSASDRREDVVHSIDMGALGFVPKCMSNDSLLQALRVVISGGIYLPASIMRPTSASDALAPWPVNGRGSMPVGYPGPVTGDRAEAVLASLGLTSRQTEVLALLLKGQSNKLSARALNLSVETIKDHVAAVLRSLNVSSRTQAVLAVSRIANPGLLSSWRESPRSIGR